MDIDSDATLTMGGSETCTEQGDTDSDCVTDWPLNPDTVPDMLLPFMMIVKYNGILARRSIVRCRRAPSIPYGFITVGLDLPEEVPPMPKELKKLMCNGIPIGSRQMHNALTGEPYFKFNGLKDETAKKIGEYLICIPANERKDIIDRMLLSCRVNSLQNIINVYQDAARKLARKKQISHTAGTANRVRSARRNPLIVSTQSW